MKHINKIRLHAASALLLALTLCSACGPKNPPDPVETLPSSDTRGQDTTVPPSPTTTSTVTGESEHTTAAPAETTAVPMVTDAHTTPVPPEAASGRFSSDTGSNLEIHLDWSVISQTEHAVTLRAEAYITCYTISVSPRHGGVLKIGNSSQNFSTETIVNELPGKQTYALATSTVDLPLDKNGRATVEISVSWPFLGSYSGITIDHLSCGGSITVGSGSIESTAPETTDAPISSEATTTAPPAPTELPLLEQGTPILFKASVFTDRSAQHWNSVTLVQSTAELSRLLEGHDTACTNTACAAIAQALGAYDDTFFAGKTLLLIPHGNLYSTTSPVEIFDIRCDDGSLYVHVRDIASSRSTAPLLSTRFYLQVAEIPADTLTERVICVVQHGAYYTDAGKYERDYQREEGITLEPVIRAYQPAAITP